MTFTSDIPCSNAPRWNAGFDRAAVSLSTAARCILVTTQRVVTRELHILILLPGDKP
jgi:hypothetical protein